MNSFQGTLDGSSLTPPVGASCSPANYPEPHDRGNCICEAEANNLGYGSQGNWRVWLATSSKSPFANSLTITPFSRPSTTPIEYVGSTERGTVIGSRFVNSIDGSSPSVTFAWTGLETNFSSNENCLDWTTNAGNAGEVVNLTLDNPSPSEALLLNSGENNPTKRCDNNYRLICMEQPN